ncbi:MAG: hypothetical protein HYT94_03620 [Parcubacteria group bacterium]|nr:hypothetical protein [Parcubacteria group bacterium]
MSVVISSANAETIEFTGETELIALLPFLANNPVPAFIIQNNLRILGISWKEFTEILEKM